MTQAAQLGGSQEEPLRERRIFTQRPNKRKDAVHDRVVILEDAFQRTAMLVSQLEQLEVGCLVPVDSQFHTTFPPASIYKFRVLQLIRNSVVQIPCSRLLVVCFGLCKLGDDTAHGTARQCKVFPVHHLVGSTLSNREYHGDPRGNDGPRIH